MEKMAGVFEPKRIGSGEVINIRDALKQIHIDWLKRNKPDVPDVVYHYTNATAFHDIIEKGELFATHISFLNDYTEYLHAIQLLIDVVKCSQKNPDLNNIRHIPLAIIYDTLNSFRLEDIPPICVLCFANARDDLTQWRSYGQGESGIAIGMDLHQLFQSAMSRNIELHPVVYDGKKQFDLAMSLIEWGCKRIGHLANTVEEYARPEWAEEWIKQFTYTAAYFAPMFKGEDWASEKEWRVVKWCTNPTDTRAMKSGSGLRIRTVLDLKCEVENQHGKYIRLPVKEVLLAPNRQSHLTKMAVIKHLEMNSYFGVDVTPSKVALRNL